MAFGVVAALGMSGAALWKAMHAPRLVVVDVRALAEWARKAATPQEAARRARRMERVVRAAAARNGWVVLRRRAVVVGAPDATRALERLLR